VKEICLGPISVLWLEKSEKRKKNSSRSELLLLKESMVKQNHIIRNRK